MSRVHLRDDIFGLEDCVCSAGVHFAVHGNETLFEAPFVGSWSPVSDPSMGLCLFGCQFPKSLFG